MAEYIVSFNGADYSDKYTSAALYESYVSTKIEADIKLAEALKNNGVLTEASYANISIMNEAKIVEKVKANWLKFVAFIKKIIANFMESMSNLILDDKKYLEKYKDIILNRTPKDDLEFSYIGDYKTGVTRITQTKVPAFDYEKYKDILAQDGDKALIENLMNGKGFAYDDSKSLADMFKEYYLGGSKSTAGKFNTLNFTDLYNFCYNFKQIEDITKNDVRQLDETTRKITTLLSANADAKQQQQESYIFENDNSSTTNQPAGGGSSSQTTGNSQQPKNDNSGTKTMNISGTTNVAKAAGSVDKTSDDEVKQLGEKDTGDKTRQDIEKACQKWIEACRVIITAKYTACQQIARDYMAIIRAHVRSYGGTDTKDTTGRRDAQTATKYQQDADNADAEAKKAAETAK